MRSFPPWRFARLASGLALMVVLIATAARPEESRPPATAPAPSPAAAAPGEDAPAPDPPAEPLRRGLSASGKRHNNRCRYWAAVREVLEPGQENRGEPCRFCGG